MEAMHLCCVHRLLMIKSESFLLTFHTCWKVAMSIVTVDLGLCSEPSLLYSRVSHATHSMIIGRYYQKKKNRRVGFANHHFVKDVIGNSSWAVP